MNKFEFEPELLTYHTGIFSKNHDIGNHQENLPQVTKLIACSTQLKKLLKQQQHYELQRMYRVSMPLLFAVYAFSLGLLAFTQPGADNLKLAMADFLTIVLVSYLFAKQAIREDSLLNRILNRFTFFQQGSQIENKIEAISAPNSSTIAMLSNPTVQTQLINHLRDLQAKNVHFQNETHTYYLNEFVLALERERYQSALIILSRFL